MAIVAAAAAGAGAANKFGFWEAMNQGGVIAWGTLIILAIMSIVSFYIMFTKLFEQQRILNQAKRLRQGFWQSSNLREGANKLEKNSAWRQIVEDGLAAQEQHHKLQDPVEAHDWLHGAVNRSQGQIQSKLGGGLAFLATVGSTAPFIGLFGTVIGIYRALINIGIAGQASIDKVAGPVGEALIMTALGLAVAVPAVLGYNWLIRRNKAISDQLSAFSNDVLGYMVSGGAVKPSMATAGAAGGATTASGPAVRSTAATKSGTAPTQPGQEPLRTGQTQTAAQASPTARNTGTPSNATNTPRV